MIEFVEVPIASAMLEHAARALYLHEPRTVDEPGWDGLGEPDRQSYRDAAGAVLRGAANALVDGADELAAGDRGDHRAS